MLILHDYLNVLIIEEIRIKIKIKNEDDHVTAALEEGVVEVLVSISAGW